MAQLSIGDDLDLYDSELQKSLELLGMLQVKYAYRPATFENLQSLANEAMDGFEKIGLIATVSVWDEDGKPKLPPEITLHGRAEEKEFDPERQQYESKRTEDVVEAAVQDFLKKGGTVNTAENVKSVEVTDKEVD